MLDSQTSPFTQAAFSLDGQRIATAGVDNTVRIWNTANWQLIVTLEGHTGIVDRMAFSPDGTSIVTSCHQDGTVRVWNTLNGLLLAELQGLDPHNDQVIQLAFSEEDIFLVSFKGWLLTYRVITLADVTQIL